MSRAKAPDSQVLEAGADSEAGGNDRGDRGSDHLQDQSGKGPGELLTAPPGHTAVSV